MKAYGIPVQSFTWKPASNATSLFDSAAATIKSDISEPTLASVNSSSSAAHAHPKASATPDHLHEACHLSTKQLEDLMDDDCSGKPATSSVQRFGGVQRSALRESSFALLSFDSAVISVSLFNVSRPRIKRRPNALLAAPQSARHGRRRHVVLVPVGVLLLRPPRLPRRPLLDGPLGCLTIRHHSAAANFKVGRLHCCTTKVAYQSGHEAIRRSGNCANFLLPAILDVMSRFFIIHIAAPTERRRRRWRRTAVLRRAWCRTH